MPHVSASYGARPGPGLLEQQSRNEELVFWPRGALARALPLHLAVLLGKAWRRGELLPFLRGCHQALRWLPSLGEHRRRLRSLGRPARVEEWLVDCSCRLPHGPRG